MDEKIWATIRENRMISEGDNVIVALSGGADSVALFHFLYQNRDELGIRLAAAHFEHGIRGEESLRDAEFVKDCCENSDIKLYMEHGRMDEAPKPRGLGTEAWARSLRYAFFEALAEQHEAKIATAHTLSDNAETVLFHAVRGAGPKGLSGIRPVRACFIRPLLGVSRAEVEAYCQQHNLDYRQDSTNTDRQYSRNRLRHDVLPALERVHPGTLQALSRMAGDMRELDALLAQQAAALLEEAGTSRRGYSVDALAAAPQPIRLKALAQLAGPAADRKALAGMEKLLLGEGTALQLPGGAIARVKYGRIHVNEEAQADKVYDYCVPIHAGEIALPNGVGFTVHTAPAADLSHFSGDAGGTSPEALALKSEKTAKKALPFIVDYDKIDNGVFRPRRPGDRFTQAGRGGSKSLKKWMNERKIPLAERASWPILADEHRVLWLYGGGFAEGLAPDKTTQTIAWIDVETKQ